MKKIFNKISCPGCERALYFDLNGNDHSYSYFSGLFFLSLINVKNCGGLILPSKGVHDIICVVEKAFRVAVSGKDSKEEQISSRNVK